VHCAAQIDWRWASGKSRAVAWCGWRLERGRPLQAPVCAFTHQRDELSGLPIAVADASLTCSIRAVWRSSFRELLESGRAAVWSRGGTDHPRHLRQGHRGERWRRGQGPWIRTAPLLICATYTRGSTCILPLVGHTGKDENRGARGLATPHVGDVDVMVQISGETTKVAQVIKGNDQPERAVARFKLEAFELGRDEDGEPITTAIVTTELAVAPTSTSAADSDEKKLSLKQIPQTALCAPSRMYSRRRQQPRPVDEHVPASCHGAWTMKVWRSRLEKLSIINAKGNPREQFRRIHVTLKKCRPYRHLGGLRVACHTVSQPVTVTFVDSACHVSRHICPPVGGNADVTLAGRGLE